MVGNPKTNYGKRFGSSHLEGGLPAFAQELPLYIDKDLIELRKLAREELSAPQIAERMGRKLGYILRLKKKYNIKTYGRKGKGRHDVTEAEREQRRQAILKYNQEHPVHQNDWGHRRPQQPSKENDWRKGTTVEAKIKFPAWHEEARKMRAEGKSNIEIAKQFNVSSSRVSQVTSPRWQDYVGKDYLGSRKGKKVSIDDVARIRKEAENTMADRTFEKFVSKNPDEKRNGVLIRCHKCNETDLFMRPGSINPVHAAQVFRHRNWLVGGGPRADTCPDCAKALTAARRDKPEKIDAPVTNKVETVVQPQVAAPNGVTTPAPAPVKSTDTLTPMSKADRRIIFAKLQDVYAEEFTGYTADWTDEKLAADLGVPVLWIEEIREENFGPNTNETILKAELTKKQLEEVLALAKKVEDTREAVEKAIAKVDDHISDFDNAVDAFNKACKELNPGMEVKASPERGPVLHS